MAFELPPLPYAHDALADAGMSKETLEFHHDIHHKAYVDNGNNLIKDTEWADKPVEEIVKGTYDKSAVAQSGIFNNASQHWNHTEFWKMMAPKMSMPSEVEKALTEAFGSVDDFKAAFKTAATTQFGSGWAWLIQKADGSLGVTKTANGVNPLATGEGTALLGLDVWEHSYYVDFRNRRPDYVTNFLDNLASYEFAEANLA